MKSRTISKMASPALKKFKALHPGLEGSSKELQSFLREYLGVGVRCYATSVDNPTQQIKNKLQQAHAIRGGFLLLSVAGSAALERAIEGLRYRWATNDEWGKELACVGLAVPDADSFTIHTIIEWRHSSVPKRIAEIFPNVSVQPAEGSPAAREPSADLDIDQLLPPDFKGNIWLELSSGTHGHGGDGWELGQRLWSPTKDRAGADRYAVMRKVKKGDLVLHAEASILVGASYCSEAVEEVDEGPPDPGTWDSGPYYRIELDSYHALPHPLPLKALVSVDEVQTEVDEKLKHYPLYRLRASGRLRTVEGMYLTKLGPGIYHALRDHFVAEEKPFTVDEAIASIFIERAEFERILAEFERKKNIILQGPPGVGKTFMARRLAYALIGFERADRVAMVQFHQSYGYEDFIQGWRPTSDGGFSLKDGIFYRFCKTATSRPEKNFVFVIDEINRGNTSKIFGELMMLLEADKRGKECSIPLTYSDPDDPEDVFHVPHNVHLIGLMNTADRSLSMVDYALRRRFAFVALKPRFGDPRFRKHLEESGVEDSVISSILSGLESLNDTIRKDRKHLGPGFEIGHSFFCAPSPVLTSVEWYREVVEYELGPLLREYWFDDLDKATAQIERLMQA